MPEDATSSTEPYGWRTPFVVSWVVFPAILWLARKPINPIFDSMSMDSRLLGILLQLYVVVHHRRYKRDTLEIYDKRCGSV